MNLFLYCADEPSEKYLILVSDGIFSSSRGIKAFWNAWTVAVLMIRDHTAALMLLLTVLSPVCYEGVELDSRVCRSRYF